MAQWRAIHRGISTSARLVSLPEWVQLLFVQLVVNADDFGLLSGDLMTLKLTCCPGSVRSLAELSDALSLLEKARLVVVYELAKQQVVEVSEWDEKQPRSLIGKRTAPKYPILDENRVEQRYLPGNSRKFQEIPRQTETETETETETDTETEQRTCVREGLEKMTPADVTATWNRVPGTAQARAPRGNGYRGRLSAMAMHLETPERLEVFTTYCVECMVGKDPPGLAGVSTNFQAWLIGDWHPKGWSFSRWEEETNSERETK